TAAVELPRRRGQQLADAQLGAVVDLLATFAEEEAEAELADLLLVQVRAQPKHLREVMRADFHRRLANVERRLAYRVRVALEHGHAERRIALLELDRKAQPGEAATEDDDIAIRLGSVHGVLAGWRAGRALNSPLGSSTAAGLARMLRYTDARFPRRRHCMTMWWVIRLKSRSGRKWLARNCSSESSHW